MSCLDCAVSGLLELRAIVSLACQKRCAMLAGRNTGGDPAVGQAGPVPPEAVSCMSHGRSSVEGDCITILRVFEIMGLTLMVFRRTVENRSGKKKKKKTMGLPRWYEELLTIARIGSCSGTVL